MNEQTLRPGEDYIEAFHHPRLGVVLVVSDGHDTSYYRQARAHDPAYHAMVGDFLKAHHIEQPARDN